MKSLMLCSVLLFLVCIAQGERACNACGPECADACGTAMFRACCFNYNRKRSIFPPRIDHGGSSHFGAPQVGTQVLKALKQKQACDFDY